MRVLFFFYVIDLLMMFGIPISLYKYIFSYMPDKTFIINV